MIRKTLLEDVSAKKGGLEMIVTFVSHILAVEMETVQPLREKKDLGHVHAMKGSSMDMIF